MLDEEYLNEALKCYEIRREGGDCPYALYELTKKRKKLVARARTLRMASDIRVLLAGLICHAGDVIGKMKAEKKSKPPRFENN